ncbi:MAG: hypothetical protein HY534_02355 [Chloroflexi bacterium]|nr:hypothetical protein [Chloroflexota bacterium]
MVRKQVYIEEKHEELLKRKASELGVSEAELIRRGIEQVCEAVVSESPEEAWRRIDDFIQKHRTFRVPQTGRNWTRDELYEDRLERHSH